jgi:hypothetical protein
LLSATVGSSFRNLAQVRSHRREPAGDVHFVACNPSVEA